MKRILTGPMQFTPYRPWDDKRKAKASARHHAMRAGKIAEQTDRIFDPSGRLNPMEKMILARLSRGEELVACDICRSTWPILEQDEAWFALLRFERSGVVYRRTGHRFRLTGCGWMLVAPNAAA